MSELNDEEFALKLQAQYDKESVAVQKQEQSDYNLAMSLVGKHDMSDSGSETDVSFIDEAETASEKERPTNVKLKTRINEDSIKTPNDGAICVDEKPGSSNTSEIIHDNRPFCEYGILCYRKNPEHLKQYQHGKSHKRQKFQSDQLQAKRSKTDDEIPVQFSERYGFYLTSVAGIPNHYNQNAVLSMKEILSPKYGNLVASAQFNYMFDVDWLLSQYPSEFRTKPLLIVHGDERNTKQSLQRQASKYSHITLCPARLEIMFGTHHTKMMLLHYEDGMRVVVHTANLIHGDWHQKTQGIWMSPKFPQLVSESSLVQDSKTNFRRDLLEYLTAYNSSGIVKWCDVIKKHDFSSANVFLIASTPGRHKAEKKFTFGHLKLRKVLREKGPSVSSVNTNWSAIAQFSSIGSLGPSSQNWLCKEFIASLSTTRNLVLDQKFPKLQLIFPSVDNVRLSLEGYPAGASLPYSSSVANKQKWLNDFFHQWKSSTRGRTSASPHIKSYCRLAPDLKSIAWFLVTSANLSKAAWGALEKDNSQLMIRSYELGALFLPEYFLNNQELSFSLVPENPDVFPMPYDIPLAAYGASDQPWIWDIQHAELPDRHGNAWMPD